MAKEATAKMAAPSPNEVEQLVLAVREALTDSMVERLTVTAGNALEVADRLNDESTREAIHTLLNRLTDLHRIGALDTLFDMVAIIHASKSASTDAIVERLFGFVEQMLNTFGSDHLSRLADGAAEAMEDAVQQTKAAKPSGGIMATIGMLSKPETQKSLLFLLKFAENLQKRCCD